MNKEKSEDPHTLPASGEIQYDGNRSTYDL